MDVFITTDFIKLDSLLKLADVCSSGGEAKTLITEGLVKVNGEVCLMRGKKLYENDTAEVSGKTLKVKK
ncbi:MAG: RNA-binding S4 domain-containing protein [Clostridia bacterium]|nr:RNA-binding S4 domain-containing protein [Clostridia bacterium]